MKTFPGNHICWSVRHVALVESLTFPGFPQKRSPCMQQMSCLKSTDASWSLWLAVNRPPMDHCGRFASNNEYYRCQQITTNSERQQKPNNINKCVRLPTYADNVALPATAATIYCMVHSKLKVQNSSTFQRTFKDPNCFFQAPKLSTKSHTLDADIKNLDCNVTLKCTVLYSPIP